jgi:antitoxin component HigA of HigAB toxin-antitoxin module
MNLDSLKRIDTAEQYEAVRERVNTLINEATLKGLLEPDMENEYTREIGRLSSMGAIYENEHMTFRYIAVKKTTPLIQSIEEEMYRRNINQKELAKILSVNEPTLSQIIRGKRRISMRIAKKLHKSLHIDAKLIIDYA